MKGSPLYPAFLALTGLLAACAEQPVSPVTSADETATPLFATSECGGKTALLDSRVKLVWTDQTTSGIRSDGSGPFEGGQNGVHGKIFYHDGGCSRSGDMVFDPDMLAGGGPRRLVFRFAVGNPAGVAAGDYRSAPFINFRQLMQLGSDVNGDGLRDANNDGIADGMDQKIEEKSPGAMRGLEFPATVALRPTYPVTINGDAPMFRVGAGAPGCEELEYESIRLERIQGVTGFVATGRTSSKGLPMGQWEHASSYPVGEWVVSGDNARCYKTLKGKLVRVNEDFFPMPFSVVVTEVRQY